MDPDYLSIYSRSGDGTESGVSWSWQAPRPSLTPDHPTPSAPIREATTPPPPPESPPPPLLPTLPESSPPPSPRTGGDNLNLSATAGNSSISVVPPLLSGAPAPACITRTTRYSPREGFLTEVSSSPVPPLSTVPQVADNDVSLGRPVSPLTVVIAATPVDGLSRRSARREELSYTSLPG